MTRIRLQHLKPGMLISEDAQTNLGKVVLSRGTRLGQDDIQTLKAWGIPEVDILDPGSEPAGRGNEPLSNSPEVSEEIISQVKVLFAKSNIDHPAIQELQRLAIHSRLP
ncbi:MAG: hypothetical protein G3M70_12020 [Candidatus Nitronauta litoralis]|uniref:Uncharacterized protein n=1 Tax=Candidatus Nitronauta litoralis TaxID=2705533 RepID=A0A7T0BX70_9BACT|nr:MAG: hypothetical protein G3M70_12020 [Candidatus Nitronauta litoralis]